MKSKTRNWLAGATLTALSVLGLSLAGCSTPKSTATAAVAPPKTVKATNQSGAQLWASNCGHCHNIRSPSSYSDAQWDVVMLHMRIRANLTADEHRQILAFLKSAH